MNRSPLLLAVAALAAAAVGPAHAARTLETTVVPAKHYGNTLFCDVVNVSPSGTAKVTIQIVRGDNAVLKETTVSLGSLEGNGIGAGGDADRCRFVSESGNPKNLRAVAVYRDGNGKYVTAVPAQ